MKVSNLMGRTLREQPHLIRREASLLARAGFLHELQGTPILLPMGVRVYQSISARVIPQDNAIMCSGVGEAEYGVEQLAALLQRSIQSYRDLPLRGHLMGCQFRIPGIRNAWTRLKEDVLLAAASQQALSSLLDEEMDQADAVLDAFGLEMELVWGGEGIRLGVHITSDGWLRYFHCSRCGTNETHGMARFTRELPGRVFDGEVSLVETPGCKTIQELAACLNIPESTTLKAVFLTADEEDHILAILQGNYEVSMEKLCTYLGCATLRPSSEEEIRAAGSVPGYASPAGLQVRKGAEQNGIRVIGDTSLVEETGYAAGANVPDRHLVGVRYPRDFQITETADIALAKDGCRCAQCGDALITRSAQPMACFQVLPLGVPYSGSSGGEQQAAAGVLTWYPLEIMLSVCEQNHDADGISWPPSISPYDVHLIGINQQEVASDLYNQLSAAGIRVLHDDRSLSPGAKFKDADLIGCPVRLTVSPRSLQQGGIEVSFRREGFLQMVSLAELVPFLCAQLK
ncbi:MAG: hypothetical protein JXA97_09080 [Anaerolineales bacterium]|nr:hypothetical protein [Anaerolineales bacterium]